MSDTNRVYSDAPVLIVGAGLVGLSSSLFLAWHGIPSLLVERHAGFSLQPRARDINALTMEAYHKVGLEEAIYQTSPPDRPSGSITRMKSLVDLQGRVLVQDMSTPKGELSSMRTSFIGQSGLEPLLLRQAQALGQTLGSAWCYSSELVSWEQDAHEVRAVIRDLLDGKCHVVHTQYLIAADGNTSEIREQTGIAKRGPGLLSREINLLFRSEALKQVLQNRTFFRCYIDNPHVTGTMSFTVDYETQVVNGGVLTLSLPLDSSEREDNFMGERGLALIRAAIGVPDLPIELIDVSSWDAAAFVAERFQQERLFLVGDAAHVIPPTGGFGANTGIADAYNLAWKLAFVLHEQAGPALLNTYNAERQPIAQLTVDQAYALYRERLAPRAPRIKSESQVSAFPTLDHDTIIFGTRIHSTAIVPSHWNENNYEDPHHPSGQPGTRAPYVPLIDTQRQHLSTLDLFGQQFVLLTSDCGDTWKEIVSAVMQHLKVHIQVYSIGARGDFVVDEKRWSDTYHLCEHEAVLVRPDGIIAWRSGEAQTVDELEQALVHILARS
jgi:2-polyprenyl-6-methoxyphenol hydroxylase-like FAD-dependent oxidoreductase